MLCNLYNNLDFMMRPNLAVHSQNHIILKRNLKLQKLYFTKLSAGVDRNQIPMIPRYIEDEFYSSNAESTPQSGQMTVSLENGTKLRSVLNSLRNLDNNGGSYQTAGFNNHESRHSSQVRGEEAAFETDLQLNSLQRLELELKAGKDSVPVSLGTSFNNSEVNPQYMQGMSNTPNSRRHPSEDSDYAFIINLSHDLQDNIFVNRATEGQSQAKVIKTSELPKASEIIKHTAQPVKKRPNKHFDQSADPKVALQHFSKVSEGMKSPTGSQSNLLAAKAKNEVNKQIMHRNLMETAHAEMKREIRNEYREPTLADKILSEKAEGMVAKTKNANQNRERNLRERGVNLRVSASPKLHKIHLSKSPLRDHSLNSPLDPLSPVAEKRSLMLPRPQLSSKLREERSPLGLKRNPVTTKINLANTHTGDENLSETSINNKSVFSTVKNLSMKPIHKPSQAIPKQGSEERVKSIKDSYLSVNKSSENAVSCFYKEEKPKKTELIESIIHNNNVTPSHQPQESRLSLATSMNSLPDAQSSNGLGSPTARSRKLSPRLTLQVAANRRKLPIQLSPDPRIPWGKPDLKSSRESSIDKVYDKKSPKSIYRLVSSKEHVSGNLKKLSEGKPLSDDALVKQERLQAGAATTKPNTRGGSLSGNDGLKKTVKIDIHVKTESDAHMETRQSHETRAMTEESEGRDQNENLRGKSSGKESPKLVYIPVKIPTRMDLYTSPHTSPKRTIDLKINLQNMHKNPTKKAQEERYTLQTVHSGRARQVFTLEDNSYVPNSELERYYYQF